MPQQIIAIIMNWSRRNDIVCYGEIAQAGVAYDRAIALAKQHQYFHEEALANELAGQFYLAQEREVFARVYLGEAYYGYFHWGATAKVQQLECQYPQFVGETATLSSHPAPLKKPVAKTINSGGYYLNPSIRSDVGFGSGASSFPSDCWGNRPRQTFVETAANINAECRCAVRSSIADGT